MAGAVELEKLVIRIVGDSSNYRRAISSSVKKTNEASRKMQRSLQGIADKFKSVGAQMRMTGLKMTAALTLPLAGFAVTSAVTFANFEASLSKIEGLVGIAGDKVKDFGEAILDLAGDVAKAPAELADAMFFVTSAGLRGSDAMDALTQSARAATAGLGETKVVADLVTSAMNAYGSAVLPAGKATDILVAAVREGKAEASELASSLGMVLPIASALGVSFDQVGAAVAGMTRTGTDAGTASIQLRQILASLVKTTPMAAKALKKMGLSGAGLRKQLKDEGLIATLTTLKENFEGNDEAAAKVFGNIRALSGVLDLLGSNMAENVAIFDRMTDTTGSTDRAFKAAANTIKFRFNQALSTFKVLTTKIGEDLREFIVPIFEKLTATLKFAAKFWDALSKPVKRFVIVSLAVVAAIGPMLIFFGTLISFAAPVVTAISSMIGALTLIGTVAAGIGAAIVAMAPFIPIFLLAIPLVGGLAAVLGTLVGSMGFVAIKTTDFGKAWAGAKTAVKDFALAAVGFIANFRENMSTLWSWLKENWWNALKQLPRMWFKVQMNILGNVKELARVMIEMWGVISGFMVMKFQLAFNKYVPMAITMFGKMLGVAKQFGLKIARALNPVTVGKMIAKNKALAILGMGKDLQAEAIIEAGVFANKIRRKFEKGAIVALTDDDLIAELTKIAKSAKFKNVFKGAGFKGIAGPELNLQSDFLDKMKTTIEEIGGVAAGIGGIGDEAEVAAKKIDKLTASFSVQASEFGSNEHLDAIARALALGPAALGKGPPDAGPAAKKKDDFEFGVKKGPQQFAPIGLIGEKLGPKQFAPAMQNADRGELINALKQIQINTLPDRSRQQVELKVSNLVGAEK